MAAVNAAKDSAETDAPFDVRERRMSPRVTTLMRAAKLVGLTGEYPCIIKDVSETGVRLKLFHTLPESRLALELAPGIHHFLECVWQRDGEAGFRAAVPIDIDDFLSILGRKEDSQVWFKVRIPGSACTSTAKRPMAFEALARQGADIETAAHFAIGELVMLGSEGLPTLNGRVASLRPGGYRVLFTDAFRLDELAALIWRLPRWETRPCEPPVEYDAPDASDTITPIKAA